MPYSQSIDRTTPGCVIFLLDQSDSMNLPVGGRPGVSRAELLADIVNDTIAMIMRRCRKVHTEPTPRAYYDLAVIGYYGQEVRSLLGGPLAGQWLASIPELFGSILRHEDRDGRPKPVWVEPFATGPTPMCAAFNQAGRLANGWAAGHQRSHPPIVINITDGMATDGDSEAVRTWAGRLRSLHTRDGNLLLFNVSLSDGMSVSVRFPASSTELPVGDEFARLLFDTSSEVPAEMRKRAEYTNDITLAAGARGFVANAAPDDLVLALRVGTSLTDDRR
ncbi:MULTISPECIES: vWA domain-containing protein [Frankia]|uniref:VWFA domain-containing protein n=1 Tax=Frankia alni (strain DSM 45986 / CECT 9034 / ACN14a) TaxID=326424 RepID=Q0RBS7_FRAAA|nr:MULTISPECIES: vWA domain-containing protein [Frankia]CAJ65107.1 conserved hypothetical protein [Frankia alni ACN14a]